MFNWLFKTKNKVTDDLDDNEPVLDKILSCVKLIIDEGDIVQDNTSCRNIPSVMFKDSKGNTLYISWYNTSRQSTCDVRINNSTVPTEYDAQILSMAQNRIQVLRKQHLGKVIDSVIE